jgi:hypothetical protein
MTATDNLDATLHYAKAVHLCVMYVPRYKRQFFLLNSIN